jgi:hypothetical protein
MSNATDSAKHSVHRLMVMAAAIFSAIVCATAGAQTAADAEPSVTPYRPSVSTPAALSAPGYLELELGGKREFDGDPARADSVPYALKLAFTADWGVRITGDAWVNQRDTSGQSTSGGGDTGVVLKRRFAIDDASAFGLEAGVKFPTARPPLGSGKSDASLLGIYSADIGAYHTDLNLGLMRVGAVDPGVSHGQALWAAALSRSFLQRWGAVGELSGTHQHGVHATSQFLLATSYNVSKALTLDAGFAHSLRSGVSDHSLFAGFTVLGPRLF